MAPADPKPTLRLFLADDHPVVLAGIRRLIAEEPGLEIVGEAIDGPTALAQATELNPDIVILDISMPGLNGLQVAERLRAARPNCRILILTVHEERAYLRRLLELGVSGYLLKRSAADELIRAIEAVGRGGVYLDPAIAALAVGSAERAGGGEPEPAELSRRESEVLRLTACGHSTKSTASELGIGVKSVETYKSRAMEKLGLRNRVELVRFALGRGWLAG